jgi:hypothetical protein
MRGVSTDILSRVFLFLGVILALKKEARRKKLSDFAWVKIHWADLLLESADMTDHEFRRMFVDGYKSWRKNDRESLHPILRRCADESMDSTTSHGNRYESDASLVPCESQNALVPNECVSISLSNNYLDISQKEKEINPQCVRELSIDPHAGAALDAEIIAAGPPKWANQVQAVFTGLRRARNNGNEIDRTKIIRGAKNYAAKCADENLEPKFIRDVDNWIADGDWGKYQEYNNPNGLMWPEEMERPF